MIKEKFYNSSFDLFSTAEDSDSSPMKDFQSNLADMEDNLFLEIVQNKLETIE